MSWAARTVRTDGIRVFVGEESSPATTYQPGNVLDFTVKVIDYKLKYRGIILYAENSEGSKVGRFVVLPENPLHFHVPFGFDDHFCAHVVAHASADIKPLQYTFKYVAPVEGTGNVTFRVLIKEGDANVGAFFWPNLEGDVTLTESTEALPRKTWIQGQLGQSCRQACAARGQGCDEFPAEDTDDATKLAVGISDNNLVCNAPLLAGCTDIGTFKKGSHCFYQDSTCSMRSTCDTKDIDAARICACAGEVEEIAVNSAATPKSGSFSLLACLFAVALFSFTGKTYSGKSGLLALLAVLCLSSMFTGALGHNWVNTLARATQEGSTKGPCPPKTEDVAHVQVGPGQKFEIEWTMGHPGNKWSDMRGETPYAYFTILRAEDEGKLGELTDEVRDAYLDDAPPSAEILNVIQLHRQIAGGEKINEIGGDAPDEVYAREILPGDPNYFTRPGPPFWGTKRYTKTNAGYKLLEYNPDKIVGFKHRAYTSAAKPWILAIYRFKLALGLDRPQDVDFSEFVIPPGSPAGSYVIQYSWKGYYDCIDVLSVSELVESPYGSIPDPSMPAPDPKFKRVDHCFTPDYQQIHGACQLVPNGDPEACLEACNTAEAECDAVVVVPAKLDTIYDVPGFHPPECDALKTANENNDQALLCYAVKAREPTTTLSKIETTIDPRDPVFLSTCMIKKSARTTSVSSAPAPVTIPAIYYDLCISCADANKIADQSKVWAWNFVTKCEECGVSVFTGGEQPEIPDYSPEAAPIPPTTRAPRPVETPTTAAPTTNAPVAAGEGCPVVIADDNRFEIQNGRMTTYFTSVFPASGDEAEFIATLSSPSGAIPEVCYTSGTVTDKGGKMSWDVKITYSGQQNPRDVIICQWTDIDENITVKISNCKYSNF